MTNSSTSHQSYLHLVPVDVWERQRDNPHYVPEAYDADGFIHCTIGDDEVISVANLFYTAEKRPMIVLTLDPTRITAPVKFEDPDNRYPHIYGPLNTDAVVNSRKVDRGENGMFLSIVSPSRE